MCDGNPKIFVAEIEHLVVGYVHATKLMDSVEEWAKNIGADAIRLTSGKEQE